MRFVTLNLFLTCFFGLLFFSGHAQNDQPIHPNFIGKGTLLGISPPLRDLPVITPAEEAAMREKALQKAARKKIEPRVYPFSETAFPKGPDEVWQRTMGTMLGANAPKVNFEGQSTSSFPPDCNGTVGPDHYMQTVNTTYAIYNKTGTLLAGPTNMNLLFGSVAGATCNDGDPLIQYDEMANRWVAVEFSLCGSNDLMLVAVSTSSDPTGTWYQYSFDVADTPDYEKLGVWQDGYYMGTNNDAGKDIYVFERAKMLNGQTAQMVGFDNSWRPGTGFLCVPPLDNDGIAAPAGTPGMFIAFNDDAVAGGTDQLWIYQLAVNWTTPASSTFTRSQQVDVTAFDSQFTSSWDDISQPTSQKLDGVPQVIMNAPQYRNFGTYQTIVCCHTVDVNGANQAGIRWYELRKTPPSTTWVIRQQGTYAPDAHSRWMGSIMLNGSGKIGLGYSISSSTVYPGIRYCGQSGTAYANATGVMDIPEETIYSGTVAQTTYNRWGDYSLLSVDPSDDKTFWYSSEYVKTGGYTKGTRIASFIIGNSPIVTTLDATGITSTTGTLNGTVNPNGLATTYKFEYGTTTSYGTATTVTSAGSGSAAVNVSAGISGLTAGTTYHFRVTATNSDGTSYGLDFTFTPGLPVVTTTAATAIGSNTATSGGNVTSDGGSAVTARGVCWATTANPTVSGNHTSDGTGTGVFTSSITGLLANTLYHIRAYVTNGTGTYYGADLTFTTLCGIVTTYPWNEGFENAGVIPTCWTQEMVNSSALNWTFITGNGGSNPSAAHGGTYNACLKDATSADNKTKLITPPLNLTSVVSPQLKFWHTQAYWSPDQDLLTIYYKTSASGTWTQLATYTASITTWTQETILLPNGTAEYYIAFEGNAKYGYGVCVDDVQVSTSCAAFNTVGVAVAASANPFCAGNPVTFTATPTNGGTSPAYQWKVNGNNVTGATNATYSYVPSSGNTVTCVLTSNVSCPLGNPATSNTITMSTKPVLQVGSITSSQAICTNSAPALLLGTPPLNGTSPTYQWQGSVNNIDFSSITGATSLTYQPGTLTTTTYYRQLQNASGTCSGPLQTNTITVTINPLQPVSVSIGSSSNPVCAGNPVTFTAYPVNGGTTPAYMWKINGTPLTGATNSTYTVIPADGITVKCILTSSIACPSGSPASSNVITMTVYPVLQVGSVTGSQAICSGTSPTALQATAPLNGTSPTYQWQTSADNITFANIAGATNLTYQPGALSTTTFYRQMQNATGTCTGPLPTSPVTVTVDPIQPLGVSIEANHPAVCAGNAVTFTATPSNGGTSPGYQWKVDGFSVSGATSSTYTFVPANGNTVQCELTSNISCSSGNPASSNILTVTVNPILPVSVTITAGANPVISGTEVTFNAVGLNGGTTPLYQWKVNSISVGTNQNTYSYTPSDQDVVTCVFTSSESCTSTSPATSNEVIMTVNTTPAINELQNITVDGTSCYDATLTIFIAGNNTTFTVLNGAQATLIAGENILLYPGTLVEEGGYMLGSIAPSGPFCPEPGSTSLITGISKGGDHKLQPIVRVIPNPTTGDFKLSLVNGAFPEVLQVTIYGRTGERILGKAIRRPQDMEFSLEGAPTGLYIIRVEGAGISTSVRIIKL